MEEQQSSSKKLSKMAKFSVVLSFTVALFAIVSLIAAGFSQISYAAPTEAVDSFKFYTAMNGTDPIALVGYVEDGVEFSFPYYLGNESSYENRNSANAVRVFCMEHNANIPTNNLNEVYSKSETDSNTMDGGVLYILSQSRVLGGPGIIPQEWIDQIATQPNMPDAATVGDFVETYATQIAIWIYMHDNYYDADHPRLSMEGNGLTDEQAVNIIKNAGALDVSGFANMSAIPTGNLYEAFIKDVIAQANSAGNSVSISLSRTDKTISKVGDDGFYQTSAILVNDVPSGKMSSFDVTLSGLDGAFVVDSKGNTKTHFDVSESNADRDEAKFFIRVPVDKVPEDNKIYKATASVTAQFPGMGAQIYGSGQYQRVVALGGPAQANSSITVEFSDAPDTGMSKAQTIYFIGLIVLLCGVGIVYANAKPAQTEE